MAKDNKHDPKLAINASFEDTINASVILKKEGRKIYT